jgi:hypothetical protein
LSELAVTCGSEFFYALPGFLQSSEKQFLFYIKPAIIVKIQTT